MLYFFRRMLRLKACRFIGRGGMVFFDGKYEYYIDTENYVPNSQSRDNYSVLILVDGIRYKSLNTGIELNKKKAIALEVQSFLRKSNILSSIR